MPRQLPPNNVTKEERKRLPSVIGSLPEAKNMGRKGKRNERGRKKNSGGKHEEQS